MLTVHNIFQVAQIAVVAIVWAEVLLQPGNVLAFVGDRLERLPVWLGKPLGLCAKCFAGQAALWYWLFNHFDRPEKLIVFTASAIFFTIIFQRWLQSSSS